MIGGAFALKWMSPMAVFTAERFDQRAAMGADSMGLRAALVGHTVTLLEVAAMNAFW